MCWSVPYSVPYVPAALRSSAVGSRAAQNSSRVLFAHALCRRTWSRAGVAIVLGLKDRAAALDEPAAAFLTEERVLLHDDFPAREHDRGFALHPASLIRVVVDPHVMSLCRDGRDRPRVPDHDVGIASDRDGPLLREHTHELRWRRGGDLDPPVQRDAILHDPAVVEQHHARFDARRAVGDLRKIPDAELLLLRQALVALLHAERTVIGRNHLQI